ncbi:hypothetical protein [Sphingorhabdus buctiana]
MMRSFTSFLAALSLGALATAPAYADDSTMAPPKKPAATATKAKPAKPHDHCMKSGDKQMHDQMMKDHSGMKGKAGMRGMKCSDKAGKMKGMGKTKPATKPADMPMSEHEDM